MAIKEEHILNYKIFPEAKSMKLLDSYFLFNNNLTIKCSVNMHKYFALLPVSYQPKDMDFTEEFIYKMGVVEVEDKAIHDQGYFLLICEKGIYLKAVDLNGYRYGINTLFQILNQSSDKIHCVEIDDEPILKNRGVMIDISRGKVYRKEYLFNLVDILAKMRINTLQLYIEHTFEFEKHKEIHDGSDPITKEDLLLIQEKCEDNGIELQANLQSFGHMNRILTRRKYMNLSESNMYWSIDTTAEESYQLLDDLYGEFLPLFKSEYVNVCSDEPYDLGKGKSSKSGLSTGELYYNHIVKLREIAQKYNKKLMIFGDVIIDYPEIAKKLPNDIIYIDWIYDPKSYYGTPKMFKETKQHYWVSPGTGNWNTLFPRLDGSITNIVNLITEGISNNAQGVLLTDWNDHGGYSLPVPAFYTYAYSAYVSWIGKDPGKESINTWIDAIIDIHGFGKAINKLAEIYQIPPIWSKNRSQCIMALFDEPIFGNTICGLKSPSNLEAYNLELPKGIDYIYERHSQHPLRPHFSISLEAIKEIRAIVDEANEIIVAFPDGYIKRQLLYIVKAFCLMCDKLELSYSIISKMKTAHLTTNEFILIEDQLRVMISSFVDLQLSFVNIWFEIAKKSEIYISLTYFSNIISRFDYLRNWISIQREQLTNGETVDWDFKTYNTGDYTTLPTY